jgi:hypothetical protein|tara:strand:+ start:193 stop:672 length:480 start_codon:yes stop_codon:yes gene_type:complete
LEADFNGQKMPKKKFKETKVGQFLLGKSGVLDSLADVLPDKGLLGVVKNLIDRDETLPQPDKEMALKLLEQDIVEAQEVSKRWESDMTSDSWLSKNTRPMSLIFLTIMTIAFIWVDSHGYIDFTVEQEWINLLKTLTTTVYVAYFGSRGAEKYKSISNK